MSHLLLGARLIRLTSAAGDGMMLLRAAVAAAAVGAAAAAAATAAAAETASLAAFTLATHAKRSDCCSWSWSVVGEQDIISIYGIVYTLCTTGVYIYIYIYI